MAQTQQRSHFLVAFIAAFIATLKRELFGSPTPHTQRVDFAAPDAADLVSVVADVLLANGALTIAAQPTQPCKLQVRITDGNGSITAGTLTLVGVNAKGQAVTQVINLAGGTRTVTTDEAYARLTSGTVAALAGHGAGDNVGIGQSAALGLPLPPNATGLVVFRAEVDGAVEAVGTVDATAGTIIPTTAPNATHTYTFWFTYQTGVGAAVAPVHVDADERSITAPNATDLESSRTLLKAILRGYLTHAADTLHHLAADTVNVPGDPLEEILPDLAAASLSDLQDMANDLKAGFNAHRAATAAHPRADAGNAISSADATDQTSLNTLLNEMKGDMNAHFALGPSTPSWRVAGA